MDEQQVTGEMGRWDELDQTLIELGDRAMVLEELDGFIAGLLVCPEPIPPGEWFARAVGLSKTRPSPFVDLDHANAVLGLVMDYYNDVATTLERHPERYQPRFPMDERNGDIIWELWIEGFGTAMNMRRTAFDCYLEVGREVAVAATGMRIAVRATLDENPDPVEYANLSSRAPENIRKFVLTLHQHRLATTKPPSLSDPRNPFAGTPQVGRNDPCPCGSGKKYKRCCGTN